MPGRTLAALAALLCLLLALPVAAQDAADAPARGAALLDLLGSVPDTPEMREFLQYGDAAAWYRVWDVDRPSDIDTALFAMGRDDLDAAAALFVMPTQTLPPDVLGIQYLATDNMRAAYGFDLFTVDRWLQAGQPPELVTILQQEDTGAIGPALEATGYTASPLGGGELYAILDDYQTALGQDLPRVGMLGGLNRVVVTGDELIVARATALVTRVVDTGAGEGPALADAPDVRAIAAALDAPALADAGELVGMMILPAESVRPDLVTMAGMANLSAEELAELQAAFADEEALPPFSTAAFATLHAPGTTTLALAIPFAPGVDAEAAARTIAERMTTMQSIVVARPWSELLAERGVQIDQAVAVDADGIPVALVTLTQPDPTPEPGDPPSMLMSALFPWQNMIFRRDLPFLY